MYYHKVHICTSYVILNIKTPNLYVVDSRVVNANQN
jgi:hypothetical protein